MYLFTAKVNKIEFHFDSKDGLLLKNIPTNRVTTMNRFKRVVVFCECHAFIMQRVKKPNKMVFLEQV